MTFSVGQLQFIDSFQFMPDSLDNLAKNLLTEDLKITAEKCKAGMFDILRKKGFYPYEYFDSMDKFAETTFPPKAAFYSQLTRKNISDADYEHAKTVWEKCGCKNLGDYHNLYLKTDVFLLADVFESFRKTSMMNYKLDPAHFYSAAGLSWQAMLKLTKVSLQLLSNIDMHLFIEKGIRGGVSTVSTKRISTAALAPEGATPSGVEGKAIMYLDSNNLYGWAMMNKLPLREIE